jgi:acetyl-CoA carboxylase biotin carboxyl carrier protein
MDPKDLKRILDALREAEVVDFTLETPEYKIQVKRGGNDVVQYVTSAPAPVAAPVVAVPTVTSITTSTPTPTPEPVAPAIPKGNTIKAPIVGTFYRSSSPDAPSYVEVGDRVEAGKVVCIIEAMKLMNEIESEYSGVIREILITNGQPVEYGQPLFVIE